MKTILAIETSCDETAISCISGEGERVVVHKEFVRSQVEIHAAFGGVVPDVAAREHVALLMAMLRDVAEDTSLPHWDALAVTAGPGLAPALRVGVAAAKGFAEARNLPIVPVCHLEGHIYASWLQEGGETPSFPALALIVSGGHTEIILMRGHGDFVRIGETVDDAAGESYDKVATMLGLGYPGGPKIDALARVGNPQAYAFPRPMEKSGDAMMSFSGIKTSVLYTLREITDAGNMNDAVVADIAASFQEAVVDILVKKMRKALRDYRPSSVILAGGVAANSELRQRMRKMSEEEGCAFFMPTLRYAMDNATMIAIAGYFRLLSGGARDPGLVAVNPQQDIV